MALAVRRARKKNLPQKTFDHHKSALVRRELEAVRRTVQVFSRTNSIAALHQIKRHREVFG